MEVPERRKIVSARKQRNPNELKEPEEPKEQKVADKKPQNQKNQAKVDT